TAPAPAPALAPAPTAAPAPDDSAVIAALLDGPATSGGAAVSPTPSAWSAGASQPAVGGPVFSATVVTPPTGPGPGPVTPRRPPRRVPAAPAPAGDWADPLAAGADPVTWAAV